MLRQQSGSAPLHHSGRLVLRTSAIQTLGLFFVSINMCFSSLIGSWWPGGLLRYSFLLLGTVAVVFHAMLVGYRISLKAMGWPLLYWIIFVVIILLWNVDVQNGSYGEIAYNVCLLILLFMLTPTLGWMKSLFNFMLFFSGIHVFVIFIGFFNESIYYSAILPLVPTLKTMNVSFRYGLNTHYTSSAIQTSIFSLLTFAKAISTTNKKKIKYIILCLIGVFVHLLLTKRGTLIAFVISAFVVFIVVNVHKGLKSGGKIVVVLGGVACVLLMLSSFVPEISAVLNRFSTDADISNGRYNLYELALSLFAGNYIVGIGWGGFKYYSPLQYSSVNLSYYHEDVHNIYLQLLCETGIVGFTMFVLYFGLILYTTIKFLVRAKSGKIDLPLGITYYLLCSLGIQCFFLTYGLFENPLYSIQTFLPYGLSCGVTCSVAYYLKKQAYSKRKIA